VALALLDRSKNAHPQCSRAGRPFRRGQLPSSIAANGRGHHPAERAVDAAAGRHQLRPLGREPGAQLGARGAAIQHDARGRIVGLAVVGEQQRAQRLARLARPPSGPPRRRPRPGLEQVRARRVQLRRPLDLVEQVGAMLAVDGVDQRLDGARADRDAGSRPPGWTVPLSRASRCTPDQRTERE
jgi:hypothetical protein